MADLSEHNRSAIDHYPLGDSLSSVREALREVHQSSHSGQATHASDDGSTDGESQMAVRGLIGALVLAMAAQHLLTRNGGCTVALALFNLLPSFSDDNFSYDPYRDLVTLVLQNASDYDIWSAVLDLIRTVTKPTAPSPPTFPSTPVDQTPIKNSSATQQRREQTRKDLEERVFQEIRLCTYQSVEGFYEKYFDHIFSDRLDRTPSSFNVSQMVQAHHKDGKWTKFPNPPVELNVVNWLFALLDECFPARRNGYYRTKSKAEMTGGEGPRQVDLLLKSDGQTSTAPHDWKDVVVVGELKQSNHDKKATLLQLGIYVREIFSVQTTRRFVHAFSFCGHELQPWVFDRSGPYSPGAFNIHNEPQQFVQVMVGYSMMTREELGLDTLVQRDVYGPFITLESLKTQKQETMRLENAPLAKQRAIVSRGTSCFETSVPSEHNGCVTKFSWVSDRRTPEPNLLKLAHESTVQGVATLVAHQDITDIATSRSGLGGWKRYKFLTPPGSATDSAPQSRLQTPLVVSAGTSRRSSSAQSVSKKRKKASTGSVSRKQPRSDSQSPAQYTDEGTDDLEEAQRSSLMGPPPLSIDDMYENRILRCLVISPAGQPIHKCDSPLKLVRTLRDAVRAHRSLYEKGQTLHRDISENNIIMTDPECNQGFSGMLIDLDLAKVGSEKRSGARWRTGTMEFMAIGVLSKELHTYRHDLESFLYVLLWQCARGSWYALGHKSHRRPSCLKTWYEGTYQNIANAKRGHMLPGGFGDILAEFPREFKFVKSLCMELRGILFPFVDGDLFTGTPEDPNDLYDPMIKAFDKAISDL